MIENSKGEVFENVDVRVTVPTQVKPIKVEWLPIPPLELMPPVPGGFQPFRAVTNFRLVYVEQPEREVTTFDPPIEVRIRYYPSDLEQAAIMDKLLRLGFWDGKQWIRITPEKHQYHLEPDSPPENSGWGVANVSNWGDPATAWGR